MEHMSGSSDNDNGGLTTCSVCFETNPQSHFENDDVIYACTHNRQICADCSRNWARLNTSCPLCRGQLTLTHSGCHLVGLYTQLCASYDDDPCPRITSHLQDLEQTLRTNDYIYVQFTYIPAPLHVIKLKKEDLFTIELSFYENFKCVWIKNNGIYYNKGENTNSSCGFWAHSIVTITPTLPEWYGCPPSSIQSSIYH